MRLVTANNTTRNTTIGDRIHVADTCLTRLFGLLGKPQLNAGSGLWIKPSSGVHTFGMTYPIDVIGLDKKGRVVKLWSHLVPFRVTRVSFKLHSVIELRAGEIQASQTQIGDQLTLS